MLSTAGCALIALADRGTPHAAFIGAAQARRDFVSRGSKPEG